MTKYTEILKLKKMLEEVFKRFKYCYKHNTSVYVEED